MTNSSPRRLAAAAGTLYLITHVTSIVALALYAPVLDDAGYITGAGADTRVLWAAFLEAVCGVAIVGTAVMLFPIVRRQHEGLALGYAGLRTLEAAIIAAGIIPLLAVVTLRQDLAGAAGTDPATLTTVGSALVAVHDWTFLLGPNLVLGVNTVLMAYLMYRSGLVPRFIGVLGLVGGPLIFVSGTAVLFGLYEQVSVLGMVTALPVFAWEICLAVRLVTKGFRPAALAGLTADAPARV
jgi:hypothetical protein